MRTVSVTPCSCGSVDLRMNHEKIAEDAMTSWVSCMVCGAMGEATDDAYSDPEGAARLWNRYPRISHPSEILAARSGVEQLAEG